MENCNSVNLFGRYALECKTFFLDFIRIDETDRSKISCDQSVHTTFKFLRTLLLRTLYLNYEKQKIINQIITTIIVIPIARNRDFVL